MFPDTNDFPAHAAEGAGDEAIAGLVGDDVLPPERGVVFRLRAVLETAVPDLSATGGNSLPTKLRAKKRRQEIQLILFSEHTPILD